MKKGLFIGTAIAGAALFFACGSGTEKKFEAALAKYCESRSESDRSGAIQRLVEHALRREFPLASVAENGAVYVREKNALRFLWPKSFPIHQREEFRFIGADLSTGAVGFSHKNEIALFDGSGDSVFSGNLPGSGDVMAMAFSHDGHYILHGNRLVHRAVDGTVTQVLDIPVTGSLPSQATCRALMVKSGDFIAVNCGHAGVYSLSIVDVRQKKLMAKDVPNASLRFGFWDGSIAYVTGGAGNWALMRMDVLTKKNEIIRRFTSIDDIAFAEKFACAIEKGALLVGNLESQEFYWSADAVDMQGVAGDCFLLKKNNVALLVGAATLFDGLKKVEQCCGKK